MPCIKCSNGKYKYGVEGNCQFDTLAKCHAAEAAIHARESRNKTLDPQVPENSEPAKGVNQNGKSNS